VETANNGSESTESSNEVVELVEQPEAAEGENAEAETDHTEIETALEKDYGPVTLYEETVYGDLFHSR